MSHERTLAWIEPVHDHPSDDPPEIWGGGNVPMPTPPIVIPPNAIGPGVPAHPIFIPVYPAHPIVIPPGAISPGVPTHPIVLPPPVPAHPIVIPPGSISPGPPPIPAHPIALPVYPANPIVLPPTGPGWKEVFILGIGWTWLFEPASQPPVG